MKSFTNVAASLALFLGIACCAASARAADEPVSTNGKLDEVTIYRGQALVTRLVDVPGAAGLHEVVVGNLPERVEPGSIYAESADGLEIRSVSYRVRPVLQDVREEVRKLDEGIRAVKDLIETNSQQNNVLNENKSLLVRLEGFTAPTANIEMTKGVLNAETLKAVTVFLFSQRQEIAANELKLTFEQRILNEKLELLNRQREKITGNSAAAVREAVVFVNLKQAGGRLRLRYLVDGATWAPSYNVRADAKRQQVTVEFNGAIEQMSGEDWTDVKIKLSTATPSLVAKAPVLAPLVIALGSFGGQGKGGGVANGQEYWAAKKELDVRRRQLESTRSQTLSGANTYSGNTTVNGGTLSLSGGNSYTGNTIVSGGTLSLSGNSSTVAGNSDATQQAANPSAEDLDVTLNDVARESQVLDLMTTGRFESSGRAAVEKNTEGVSVSYELAGRISVPSRSDRQLIQIAALPMKAEFYKVGIPLLTSYVYEEASVVNDSRMVLLAGPVTTYLGEQFVGQGDVPTVAVGENFTVGFGIDSSLRTHRELVKKIETIQGGNRLVDFTYQLVVENFGSEPTEVRMFDRMPTAKENEVKVTLSTSTPEVSTDARYQQTDRKKGLLRWDVKVAAQAVGVKALTINYQMQMEYDKQLSLSGIPMQK